MFRSEMTSPLSERNWDQTDVFREGRQEASENDLLLKMQRKMTGLDSKQKKVIKEYETELDAMRNEIKMIKSSYDHLKQKNARYRHHLKDKTELVKKLQEEQARMVKAQGVETSWSSEKTKLLAKLKQLEVEKKQVEDQYRSLLNVKDENVKLTSEVESLRFKETLWTQEREKMERKRRQGREPDTYHPVDRGPNTLQTGSLMSSSLKFGLSSGEFNFDDAWNHITNSTHLTSTPDKSLFSSLPITGGGGSTASASYSSRTAKDTPTNKDGRHSSARHPLRRTRSDFQESSDLQDIRKSLNEAREELMRSTSNIDIELESARSARQAKSDSQSKKDQFLQELRAREEMNTVHGMTHQRDADANEVRSMICSMEAKIASLETNCLSEVQNLVSNVDILKNELLNTQQELQYLKEYSKKVETQREQEKIQLMNESRELKLDLSSLRTEIRDKSEASDRTDASRSVFSDSREQEENFDKHYSPLVGFVGSRCDYLKIKLDTLKKHLKNLDLQTKTVLNQSLTSSDDGRQGDELQQLSPEKSRKIPKSKAPDSSVTPTSIKRLKKSGGRGSGSSGSSGRGSGGRGGNDGSKSDRSETNDKRRRSSGMGVKNGSGDNGSGDNSDKSKNTGGDDGGDDSKMDFIDDDEIFVLTPRPHRNKYEEDMDLLIVENGQNIERLRLPSLEEEEDEDGDDDDDDDDDDDEDDETMENSDEDGDDTDKMSTERGSARSEIGTPRDGTGRRRVLESPRLSDRSSARLDDDEIVSKYLVNEETRTSSLAHQVDTHFELLEKELARRERRRTSKGPPPMQADHRLFSNTRSKH